MHLTPLLWHLMHRLIPQVAHLRRFGLPQLSRDGQRRGRGSSVTRSQCWLPQVVASSVPTPVIRLPPPAHASASSDPRTTRVRDPDDLPPVPAAPVLVGEDRTPPVGESWRCIVLACPARQRMHCARRVVDVAPLDRPPGSRHHETSRVIRDLHRGVGARRQRGARLILPHLRSRRGGLRRSLRLSCPFAVMSSRQKTPGDFRNLAVTPKNATLSMPWPWGGHWSEHSQR